MQKQKKTSHVFQDKTSQAWRPRKNSINNEEGSYLDEKNCSLITKMRANKCKGSMGLKKKTLKTITYPTDIKITGNTIMIVDDALPSFQGMFNAQYIQAERPLIVGVSHSCDKLGYSGNQTCLQSLSLLCTSLYCPLSQFWFVPQESDSQAGLVTFHLISKHNTWFPTITPDLRPLHFFANPALLWLPMPQQPSPCATDFFAKVTVEQFASCNPVAPLFLMYKTVQIVGYCFQNTFHSLIPFYSKTEKCILRRR